ncbi:hypothetical protein J3A83DRAFT_4084967, partial [Scleroderma citrinum]
EFAKVAQRIETLTQVLRCLRKYSPPQRFDNSQIHDLLRHFAVLLTCGRKGDIDAKRVTAVTGKLTAEGRLHTMAITQNPFSPQSFVSRLGVDQVIKTNKGFEEVINGDRDAESLSVHIGDLWAAFASCDPAKDPQAPAKLLNFVISRSFRKLRARLQFGEWRCKERLSNKIQQWQPAGSNINPRWVNVPLWLKECVSQFPSVIMKHRVRIGEDGREVLQWEFSDETRKLWATVLATMLSELRQAVEKAHRIRTRSYSRARPSKEERDAISNVSLWSYNLFSYIYWEEGIVQTLLTETDLADAMLDENSSSKEGDKNILTTADPAEYEGKEVEMHLQGNIHGGPRDQLLRYLQALVAWPGAVNSLLADGFCTLSDDLSVGLVKVQPCILPLCSAKEMMNEYVRSRDANTGNPNLRLQLENTFKKYCSRAFYRTVHAEATLMGLVSYLASSNDARVNYGEPIPADDLRILQDIIDSDATEIGIAVGKDCCWCCNRLAYHLSAHLNKNFKLAGTHGIIYGWKPPRVGIPVSVLKLLEDDLWVELVEALRVPPRPRGFRQNSG